MASGVWILAALAFASLPWVDAISRQRSDNGNMLLVRSVDTSDNSEVSRKSKRSDNGKMGQDRLVRSVNATGKRGQQEEIKEGSKRKSKRAAKEILVEAIKKSKSAAKAKKGLRGKKRMHSIKLVRSVDAAGNLEAVRKSKRAANATKRLLSTDAAGNFVEIPLNSESEEVAQVPTKVEEDEVEQEVGELSVIAKNTTQEVASENRTLFSASPYLSRVSSWFSRFKLKFAKNTSQEMGSDNRTLSSALPYYNITHAISSVSSWFARLVGRNASTLAVKDNQTVSSNETGVAAMGSNDTVIAFTKQGISKMFTDVEAKTREPICRFLLLAGIVAVLIWLVMRSQAKARERKAQENDSLSYLFRARQLEQARAQAAKAEARQNVMKFTARQVR